MFVRSEQAGELGHDPVRRVQIAEPSRLRAFREVLGVDHRMPFALAVCADDLGLFAALGGQKAGRVSHSGLSFAVAAFMNFAQAGTATSAANPLGRIVRG